MSLLTSAAVNVPGKNKEATQIEFVRVKYPCLKCQAPFIRHKEAIQIKYDFPQQIENEQLISNEELAQSVKNSDTQALETLWRQNVRLVHKLMSRYFPLCSKYGCTAEDLQQESFPVVKDAAIAYDPNKPYCFTTYLSRQVQQAVRRTFGWRREEAPISLNQPMKGREAELGDFIENPEGEAFKEQLEENSISDVILSEIGILPETEYRCIIAKFWGEHSHEEIAVNFSFGSVAEVNSAVARALRKLRSSKILRELWHEWRDHRLMQDFYRIEEHPRYFSERSRAERLAFEAEQRVKKLEQQGVYLSYGKRRSMIDYPALRVMAALQNSFTSAEEFN